MTNPEENDVEIIILLSIHKKFIFNARDDYVVKFSLKIILGLLMFF
jgi:hypothetical protein